MNLTLNAKSPSRPPPQTTIHILLADDDLDDRFFLKMH